MVDTIRLANFLATYSEWTGWKPLPYLETYPKTASPKGVSHGSLSFRMVLSLASCDRDRWSSRPSKREHKQGEDCSRRAGGLGDRGQVDRGGGGGIFLEGRERAIGHRAVGGRGEVDVVGASGKG